mmetsp:Transcript_12178/g.28284  ORF Transcript_12178/g.28284 Transcript_12178/m.28284 type:complete len:289 (+) Transcript_12178:319-1185(+)
MRHDEHGAVLELAPDRRLHQSVCVGVHARCGLIHHNHLGPPQQHPGEAHELALSRRQVVAIVRQDHPQLLGLRRNHRVEPHLPEAPPDLIIAPLVEGIKERPQGPCEKLSVLRHNRHGTPEVQQPNRGNIDTVYPDEALVQLNQPEQSGCKGALPGTSPPYDTQLGAPLDCKAHRSQHGLPPTSVSHDRPFELHLPPAGPRLGQALHPRRRVQRRLRCKGLVLVDTLRRNHGVFQILPIGYPRGDHLFQGQAVRHGEAYQARGDGGAKHDEEGHDEEDDGGADEPESH